MGDSQKKVEDDGAWMWVSFAPKSKLIIDCILGPRKQYVAYELIKVTYKHLSDLKPFLSQMD